MTITVAEMTNISNNVLQEFTFNEDVIRLEYKTDLSRWLISVVGRIHNRVVTAGTELLIEHNLGYHFVCVSEKVNGLEVGAFGSDAFTNSGNSTLLLVTEDE